MRSQWARDDTIRRMCEGFEVPTRVAPVDGPLRESGERPVVQALAAELEPTPWKHRYTFTATLGEGGMGEVRLCEDRRIHRQVAMKVMHADRAANPDERERFFREVAAQGRLEHPAIVPVYDAAIDESDTPYFVMRRVRGPTLAEILDRLRRNESGLEREHSRHSLLSAFGSVCLAVQYAHENGVVHCDLKPSNVMLGSYGEVYVLDWGLSVRAGDPIDAAWVYGTPGYMAPEQIRGEPPAARVDVYSLGAILYEILTLEPMFASADPLVCFHEALAGGAPAPSSRAPHRDVPPELDAIWAKATALDPAERYSTARALRDDVERFLAGDRDTALRRAMSSDEVAEATAALARARRGAVDDSTARSEAMRAIGRALALDPTNAAAMRGLARLLLEPPSEMPSQAKEEMHAAERVAERVRARVGAAAFLAWFAFLPTFFLNGVRNVPALILVSAAWLAAAVLQIRNARRPREDGTAPTILPIVGAVAVAGSSVVMGPVILTPILATVFTLGFALAMRASQRFVPLVAGCLSILVPQALEWLGVVPPWYRFVDGKMTVFPFVSNLTTFGHLLFIPACLVCVILAWYYGTRVRGNLSTMQRRVYTQAWQLRQLLPKDAERRSLTR